MKAMNKGNVNKQHLFIKIMQGAPGACGQSSLHGRSLAMSFSIWRTALPKPPGFLDFVHIPGPR